MRLLLAEDDPQLSATLGSELRNAGYAVDIAENGVDAEHLAISEPYDAVILDLGLPLRSGLEVLQRWRAQQHAVPVIILTARNAWHEKVEGFKAGCDDYLGKPFHTLELLARLSALIRRSQTKTAGVLTVNGITLDETRRIALKGNNEITLTGVEFRILRYFMLHAGKVLSQSELREHTYDDDSEKDSNVIEVFVRRLRAKLGNQCITTRRGQGYVFQVQGESRCGRFGPD